MASIIRNGQVDKKATKPPPRFTPSTLLAAMKEIYKYVKDESLKKKLKEVQGIGTEATRATIIQELIQRKFLTTEARRSTSSRQMTPTFSSIPCLMKCSIPMKRLSGKNGSIR